MPNEDASWPKNLQYVVYYQYFICRLVWLLCPYLCSRSTWLVWIELHRVQPGGSLPLKRVESLKVYLVQWRNQYRMYSCCTPDLPVSLAVWFFHWHVNTKQCDRAFGCVCLQDRIGCLQHTHTHTHTQRIWGRCLSVTWNWTSSVFDLARSVGVVQCTASCILQC